MPYYKATRDSGDYSSKKKPQKKKAPITAATIVAKKGLKGAVKNKY